MASRSSRQTDSQTGRPGARGRHAVSLAAILLGAGLLTGCGGSSDTDPATGDDSSSAVASASSEAPTASSSPATSSSAAASPASSASGSSVAPATGKTVTLSSLSFQVPQGWKLDSQTSVGTTGFDPSPDDGIGSVIVIDQSAFGAETLDSEAKVALQTAKSAGVRPTRGPDLTIGGVKGYVVSGSSSNYGVYYVFGTVTDDHDVSLLFQYTGKPADAQATIASVLASITWT